MKSCLGSTARVAGGPPPASLGVPVGVLAGVRVGDGPERLVRADAVPIVRTS
jgi:hypothetical protein